MWYNLLTNVAEKTRMASIPESALYALLGFVVVFVGIAFLILVVWLVGKCMTKTAPSKTVKTEKAEKPVEKVEATLAVADATDETLTDETVAVIMAAITAYYQKVNPKCEFTVKRIKRKRI